MIKENNLDKLNNSKFDYLTSIIYKMGKDYASHTIHEIFHTNERNSLPFFICYVLVEVVAQNCVVYIRFRTQFVWTRVI